MRDWLYVEGHCKAIYLIIHNGKGGEVYNVGGHNEKTEYTRKFMETDNRR